MRILTPIQALGAAAALALISGCAEGSVIAPKPPTSQEHERSLMDRIPATLSPLGMLKVNMHTGNHFVTFDTCPATGNIEYISDFNNSVISIYKGNFAGQTPCGQLTAGLVNPQGMFIRGSSHELYVANTGGEDVLVFRRGATSPVKTYSDPSGQFPADVTIAKDGTVIASNIFSDSGGRGSISTWHLNGTFVGNFKMVNDLQGVSVTVQKNGTLYFDDVDSGTRQGLLWTGSCPLGACGKFTSTGAKTAFPGGLRSANGEEVVQVDQGTDAFTGTLITYQSFPKGVSCLIVGASDPVSIDIKKEEKDVFYADADLNVGGEIAYPSCAAVGTVPGNPNGLPIGAAADPPDPL
ncbi:MAG TPA: hypothetical protein VII69_11460 [Candidatus Eremiobacteraceae bacterium]